MEPTPKSPLLRPNASPTHQSTPLAANLVTALSNARVAFGLTLMLAPGAVGKVLAVPMSPPTSAFIRLFGGKDLVLGELTWFTRPKVGVERTEVERRELKRVLWANVAADGLDVVISGILVMTGGMGGRAALLGGGGAAVYAAFGLWTLSCV
ncbi:hypothetical protein BT63DRAFT_465083 [Microthyrium microscopicum]|uniref:Uncharacterized protein n=1 Tax=Microthyrium microscopicum TaxID=703497 RepID=A0A6A6TWQ6_9PEZI|nr:hypothetical protein BT63DRAFT_465083 [Microthyrium microscopicum]